VVFPRRPDLRRPSSDFTADVCPHRCDQLCRSEGSNEWARNKAHFTLRGQGSTHPVNTAGLDVPLGGEWRIRATLQTRQPVRFALTVPDNHHASHCVEYHNVMSRGVLANDPFAPRAVPGGASGLEAMIELFAQGK